MGWRCKDPEFTQTSTLSSAGICAIWPSHSRRSRRCSVQTGRRGDLRARPPAHRSRRTYGAWPKIPGIGPGSTRVIREVLETGGSPTVEHAIEQSDRRADIERRRQLRRHFLSCAESAACSRIPHSAVAPSGSTSATCKCIPNGAAAPRRCRTSRMPVVSVAINMDRVHGGQIESDSDGLPCGQGRSRRRRGLSG